MPRPMPTQVIPLLSYMKTANTTPRPATVTNPPLCANSDGAPAVVAITAPADVVLDDEVELEPDLAVDAAVDEAFPLADDPVPDAFVEFPALPVAVAAVDPVAVAEFFPAFVAEED